MPEQIQHAAENVVLSLVGCSIADPHRAAPAIAAQSCDDSFGGRHIALNGIKGPQQIWAGDGFQSPAQPFHEIHRLFGASQQH